MIKPYRPGGSAGPDITAASKRRLWIFAVLFVLVLAAFLGAKVWENVERDKAKKDVPSRKNLVDIAPSVDEEGRPLFTYEPQTPLERRDLKENELREKLGEFFQDGILKDGPVEDDHEVLAWLVDKATWDPGVTNVSPLLFRGLDEEKVIFEPGPHRGTLATAFGQIVKVLPEQAFPGRVKGVTTLYRALFRTAGGVLYEITNTKPVKMEPGDWVQASGIFYRTRTEKEGEPPALCLVVVNDRVENAYPPNTVTEIDPSWADQVLETTYAQAHDTDEAPFWLILNYVKNLGVDGYHALKKDPGFAIHHFGRLAREAALLPDEYRFKFISARGKIVRPHVDVLQLDNPGKITRLDSAVLVQPVGPYFVRLASPRPWSEYDFKMGTQYVQVEGIFYKQWHYVPTRGGQARFIPLLIVTDVFPVDAEESAFSAYLPYIFMVAAAGIVCVFLVVAFRDRRQVKEFREKYRQMKEERERRQAEKQASEEEESPDE
jgi:hypothetical protein